MHRGTCVYKAFFNFQCHLHPIHSMMLLFGFRRYETCWLPVLARFDTEGDHVTVAAPLDVDWIWHVHRLAPAKYHADCRKIIGESHCPLLDMQI